MPSSPPSDADHRSSDSGTGPTPEPSETTNPGVGGNDSAPPPILPEFPRGSFLWKLGGLFRQMRPEQWTKNAFVLAPLVFAKHLTHPSIILSAIGGFGVFCLLASSIYTLNDLVDVEADRIHPKKRFRPIASGRVSVRAGKFLAGVLVTTALVGAALGPWQFLATAVAYLVLQVAYSFKLKKIAYLDVSCISAGFVLRVLAGSFAVRVAPSFYLVACTALLALFLGFGKRRHELAGANAAKQRAALEQYSPRVLTTALGVTGLLTVATYLSYTLDSTTREMFHTHWLWVTTIHPIFGVIRFLQLVVSRPKAESPTQEMLRDVPFVTNILLYVAEVIVIVYQLRPEAAAP